VHERKFASATASGCARPGARSSPSSGAWTTEGDAARPPRAVQGAQFVLLGEPVDEDGISSHFRHLERYLNDNPDCHLEISYTEELAHLVYAGADMLAVSSTLVPCGLAPMVGLRYGTVPGVRSVGGMVDTVFDRDYSSRRARGPQRIRVPAHRQPCDRVRAQARAATLVRSWRGTGG